MKLSDNVYLVSDSVVFKKQTLTDIFSYTTKEQVTGTWEKRDGTIVPHYRKTIYIDSLPNNTTANYDTGLTELDFITNFYGSAYAAPGHKYQMTLPNINATSTSATVGIGRDNNNIQITTAADRSGWWGHVTIEYTKITD